MAIEFHPCAQHTVGVEWELQLLDATTLDLYDGIMPLLEFFPERDFVKPEFVQSSVELTSDVAHSSNEAVEHVGRTLAKVLKRCEELEMTLCGAGTHPFGRRLALITPIPRYRRIEKDAGYLAQTQITFSAHVHIGMRSGDEAIRAMSRLIPALPVFIALSANSPFWRGHDTGHVAYRHRILAAFRDYGLPVTFRDWRHFQRFHAAARKSGMIRNIKDLHWDIRPHPDYGTIEIRVMDAPCDLQTLHLLVAVARVMAIGMTLAPHGEIGDILPLDLPWWIARENCYRAAHRGLEAEFIHDEDGGHRKLRGLAQELLGFCEPAAEEAGERDNLARAQQLLLEKPGYALQREDFAETRFARSVAEGLCLRLQAAVRPGRPTAPTRR